MKIQCNVCGVAEANLLCCADEAALCRGCDQRVHAANKLAGKHQRVPLSTSSSQKPKCDICQGYENACLSNLDRNNRLFLLPEDRALLCRKCDFAIHTKNTLVSRHQRFLLTGVKVGLEATEPGPSSSSGRTHSHSNEKISGPETRPPTKGTTQVSSSGQHSKNLPVQASMVGEFSSADLPFTGGSAAGSTSQWQLDEFLGFGDYNQNYNFMDNSSAMADSGKQGDADNSPILQATGHEFEGDECTAQAPDTFWAVPEMLSPPTASGLYWPKYSHSQSYSAATYVPDITSSPVHNVRHHHSNFDSSS
ncbi:UNVERIFIED_CONTAM: B-box zinc finger protein 22 [Sesamum latifolium]|uniref:B-box zinc finger protein 22 n=1 Tax=Sesamum latifolium TaxID=2727402 RepID=A0AAW2WUJ2_9LAMI